MFVLPPCGDIDKLFCEQNHSSYSNAITSNINCIIIFILEDIIDLTCKKKVIYTENVFTNCELPIIVVILQYILKHDCLYGHQQ